MKISEKEARVQRRCLAVVPKPQGAAMSSNPVPMTEQVQRAVLAMPVAQALQLRFRHVEPGRVELELPVSETFCFRPGQLQATAVFAAASSTPASC
jgi:acyl-coenzyme A thioesterase PaaI-like protein